MTKSFYSIYVKSPVKYNKILDSLNNKFPMDAPKFGKPNVLINTQ